MRVFSRSLARALGCPEHAPDLYGIDTLLATPLLLSFTVNLPVGAVLFGLAILLLFLILRLATRRDWIATVLITAFLVAGDLIDSRVSRESLWLFLLIATAAQGVFMAVLLRLGVLAAIACIWTADMLVGSVAALQPSELDRLDRLLRGAAAAAGRRCSPSATPSEATWACAATSQATCPRRPPPEPASRALNAGAERHF